MNRIVIDFETYSPEPISAGSVKYTEHPDADIVLYAYKINNMPTRVQLGGHLTADLEAVLARGEYTVYAHNALFDFLVWNRIGSWKYSWPGLHIGAVIDTMALSNRYSLPSALADVGGILNVPVQKDRRGKALIKKISIPTPYGKRPVLNKDFTATDLHNYADYCRQDVDSTVAVIAALPADTLTPREQYYWELTQYLNLAGLPIDEEAVHKISGHLEGYVEEMSRRVPEITNGQCDKVTQVAKIVAWINSQGVKVDDLKAPTVEKLLMKDLPMNVREILELRQTLGRSSVAKYTKIIEMLHFGRVFNNLQYWGAGPGRWAGRGFQAHNLPRASVKDPEKYIDDFKNYRVVEDAVNVAKALIRPMICAPEGSSLLVSDYSSIENYLLVWAAGDRGAVELLANGGDQYIDMASFLYQVPIDQVTKAQRQMGKVIILGCLASGTPVLTFEGPKAIENVKLTDQLWDGEAWVLHSGVLNKGDKPCSNFSGVYMTLDHKVYFTEEAEEVWHHLGNTQSAKRGICLVIGKLLSTFPDLGPLNEMLDTGCDAASAQARIFTFWRTLSEAILQNVESAGVKRNINSIYQPIAKLQGLIKQLSIDLSIDGMPLKLDALSLQLANTAITEGVEFQCAQNGWTVLDLLLNMLWVYPDSITHTSNWIESTTLETTNPGTLNSRHVARICSTHDILNAGSKHRFTILTPNGPLLVSNCGYGMGASRFVETALTFGMTVTRDEAEMAVKAYRRRYRLVEVMWYALASAAKMALITPGKPQQSHKCTFTVVKDRVGTIWLQLTLPSGRNIYYNSPRLEHDTYGPVIKHMGTNPYSKKWGSMALIPGRITENVIQATARDIMAQGMQNICSEMPEAKLILTVHDEAVAEIVDEKIQPDTLTRFNNLLCKPESWYADLPLKAEGFIAKRYRK